MKRWVDYFLEGEESDEYFCDQVDRWHSDVDNTEEVHEYLGLTWEEYKYIGKLSRLKEELAKRGPVEDKTPFKGRTLRNNSKG